MTTKDLLFWQILDEAMWDYEKSHKDNPVGLQEIQEAHNLVQDIMSDIDFNGEIQRDLDWGRDD